MTEQSSPPLQELVDKHSTALVVCVLCRQTRGGHTGVTLYFTTPATTVLIKHGSCVLNLHTLKTEMHSLTLCMSLLHTHTTQGSRDTSQHLRELY